MDSNSDAGTTGQVTSTYHREAATDVGDTTRTPSTSPRLDTQSRNNLRQASAALDTAYERITSLRNSINNMLNRIPAEVAGTGPSTSSTNASDSQPRHPFNHDASIRPPHSALVLSSGEQVVEELNLRAARLRSLIPPTARQRLEEFESSSGNHTRREFGLDRFSQNDRPRFDRTDIRPPPIRPPPRSPPMPDLILPNARGTHSVHRDDSSTMIGRRVATRLSAADGQGSLSSRLTLSQIEQRLQAQTAQVARELESMTQHLAATTSRRVELASARTRNSNAATAAREHQAVAPPSPSGDSRSAPNPTISGGPLRPARDVTLIDNTTRIFLPQPMSRTSSDGTPLDELSAPARRSLSAAFREQIATYRDHVQAGSTSQDTPRNLANAPEVRGTLVNLLTRDREEQILPVRQPEHTRLGIEISRRDAPTRSDPSSPAGGGQGRRRRGWTRLNADGDEIDSDEDDNVSAQTRRLRMRFTYGTTNVDQPATRSVTIEDILWRTSGSDSEADAVSVSPDTSESCQSLFQGSPPRPSIRHPHPLPTPVEDMLIYPIAKTPRQPRVICVSKYASLAGR